MADPILAGILAEATALNASLFSSVDVVPLTASSRDGGILAAAVSSGTTSKLLSVVKIDCNDVCVCFGRIVAGSAFSFYSFGLWHQVACAFDDAI